MTTGKTPFIATIYTPAEPLPKDARRIAVGLSNHYARKSLPIKTIIYNGDLFFNATYSLPLPTDTDN